MGKVLITGAQGYLGACIFNELSKDKLKIVQKLNIKLEDIKPKSLKYDIIIHSAGALRNRMDQLQV